MVYSPRWGPGVAHRLHTLAAELVEAEHRGGDFEELAGRAAALGAEVTHYLGAAVHDARAQGAGWSDVAQQARVSEATARAKWGPQTVRRQMRMRAEKAVVTVAESADAVPPTGASEHRQRLGAALSFLLRAHDRTAQEVAKEAGVSPSGLSRLLAGQRVPDWPTVFTVVSAAGGRAGGVPAVVGVGTRPPPGAPELRGDGSGQIRGNTARPFVGGGPHDGRCGNGGPGSGGPDAGRRPRR